MGTALPFVQLGAGRSAIAIFSGTHYNCAILDDHSLKCWGYNGRGNLGVGDTADRGKLPDQMGDALPVVQLGNGRTAVSVSTGDAHTCALLNNQQVKCWGNNDFGSLGLGDVVGRGGAAAQMGDALGALGF